MVWPERFSGQQTVLSAATQGDFTLPVLYTRAVCRRFETAPIGCMDMFGIEISTVGYRGAKEEMRYLRNAIFPKYGTSTQWGKMGGQPAMNILRFQIFLLKKTEQTL